MADRPKTIDEYLAGLSDDRRTALEDLRRLIHEVAPDAEECISYGMPAFRYGGRMLVGFAAAKSHLSLYAWNGTAVAAHKDELQGFSTSTGTIRFTPERPLPAGFVRDLVRERMAQNRR